MSASEAVPRARVAAAGVAMMVAASASLSAHSTAAHEASAWTFEPGVVSLLLVTAFGYLWGVRRLWRTAGIGQGVSRSQAAAFGFGWAALVAALVSPVDSLSEVLFWVHMVQHELLILVAAPLFAVASPLVVFLWIWPAATRRRLARAVLRRPVATTWAVVTAPATVWIAHGVALWVWHLPSLYEAALRSDVVHAVQHLCFFVSALLFWWGITHGRYGRVGYGAATVYVFATSLHSSVLGALLTFSSRPWYPAYASGSAPGGLTPIEDQQLAGLVMWVPASLVFVAVGLVLLAAWIRESERRVKLVSSLGAIVAAVGVTTLLSACNTDAYSTAKALTGGDPSRGASAIRAYGCDSCHVIPGINSAQSTVGPPLTDVASRFYLAGRLQNTPANMQRWIQHPREVEPHSAMPDLGVTDNDVRDITAYLYTLR